MRSIWKHWRIFIVLITLSGLLISNAFATRSSVIRYGNSTLSGTDNLVAEINRIISDTDPDLTIGIQIKSMKYGDTLYSKNEQNLFMPASILKVFTAESALLLLGPQYKFLTRFVTDAASITNGILYGNLYLVHSGDPSLTYYDLADLMNELKTQQIQQISGNVYIDESAYDQVPYGPGWVWNDKRYCYAAPISASIINHNCLTFQGKNTGHLTSAIANPFYSSFQSGSLTKSSTAKKSCNIQLGAGNDNSLVFSGCLPKGRSAQTVINDTMQYNQSLLANLFKHFRIQVNGNITAGTAPDKLSVIAVHQSEPLHILITKMLKMSDNVIAGSLFKKLGEIYSKQPGSWENGSTAVTEILSSQIGVDVHGMNIIDGSGLSRYNQITPEQMIKVLDFAYHHYESSYDFISALPVAGVDGTLKHRLRNIAWKVRAKTGTMTGVVALAGYAVNRDKDLLAFVIIVNGRNGMGWKYRALEDNIVTALTRYSR